MKMYIMSISHAMIMTRDLSYRIKRIIQKDMVNILRVMNLLRKILGLHYTITKLISPHTPSTTLPLPFPDQSGRSGQTSLLTLWRQLLNGEWSSSRFPSQYVALSYRIAKIPYIVYFSTLLVANSYHVQPQGSHFRSYVILTNSFRLRSGSHRWFVNYLQK